MGGHVKCPICKQEHLVRSERSGVANDYCPKCRDELDRKQERETHGHRSTTDTRPPVPPDPRNQPK
jgi:Zn-finger nucleic acid-binding protein